MLTHFKTVKWPTWHAPTALATARKLAALRPTRIAVGHGPAFDPAAPALMSALEHAEASPDAKHAGGSNSRK